METSLEKSILEQKRIVQELKKLFENLKTIKSSEEKKLVEKQIDELKKKLKNVGEKSLEEVAKKNLTKSLVNKKTPKKESMVMVVKDVLKTKKKVDLDLTDLEKEYLKKLHKKERKTILEKEKKYSNYVKISSKYFGNYAKKISKNKIFEPLEKDLIKSKLYFIFPAYLSTSIFTIGISFILSLLIFIFLMFFDVGFYSPIISLQKGNLFIRMLELSWILVVIPFLTGVFLFFYPSLEKKSLEKKIEYELPFATIHMSAISGSMIDPSKIFEIMISTKEYPSLEKDFTRLLNEVNIYGYDLVTSLKNVAMNTPSKKLSELLNGLATTINSGGNLSDFFEKRAQTLLFEHRLNIEKESKAAETFMDIYISVVIAAPMILMLLLIMMKISGLGIQLSNRMITTIMVLGVTMINIIFLGYLYIKGRGLE